MMMYFYVLAAFTILGFAAAMSLRNLVHCVIALTLGLVGLAALYLELGAQFVGFTQILVYIGAVSVLVVFAIMMTRSHEPFPAVKVSIPRAAGTIIAAAVFCVLGWALWKGSLALPSQQPAPDVSIQQIGLSLMHRFVLPLEIAGLLLTVALIGAGVLAMDDAKEKR